MPDILEIIFLLAAAVAFVWATLGVTVSPRVNMVALGLLLWVVVPLWSAFAALS